MPSRSVSAVLNQFMLICDSQRGSVCKIRWNKQGSPARSVHIPYLALVAVSEQIVFVADVVFVALFFVFFVFVT